MAQWRLDPAFGCAEGDHLVAAFDGVPVVVRDGGIHPEFVDEAGRRMRDVPHVDIAMSGGYIGADRFVDRIRVSAVGVARQGHGRALPVVELASENPRLDCRGALELAAPILACACEILKSVDAEYEKYQSLLICLSALPSPMTRSNYEAACHLFATTPCPDADLSPHGVFDFPFYSVEQVARYRIDQMRGCEVERERHARQGLARAAESERRLRRIKEGIGRPVTRTYERLCAGGLGEAFFDASGELHVPTATGAVRTITAEDPSAHGSHLLGHVGERGCMVTFAVHAAPGPERQADDDSPGFR